MSLRRKTGVLTYTNGRPDCIEDIFESLITEYEERDSFSQTEYLHNDSDRIDRIKSGRDYSARHWYAANGAMYSTKPWRKEDKEKGNMVPLSEHYMVSWEINPVFKEFMKKLEKNEVLAEDAPSDTGFLKVWDGGYLSGILRQWVPDTAGGTTKSLVRTLESNKEWQEFVARHVFRYPMTHAETKARYVEYIEEAHTPHGFQFERRIGSLIKRNLPSDERSVAYSLCRMAGYSFEEIVEYISALPLSSLSRLLVARSDDESEAKWKVRSLLPHYGGYVTTALLSWWPHGFAPNGMEQYCESPDFFLREMVRTPHVPIRNYCINLANRMNYGHETSWYRIVGKVQLQHLRWAGKYFDVDTRHLEHHSSECGKTGRGKGNTTRGRKGSNPGRAAWYRDLGKPSLVSNEQIDQRAKLEFDLAKVECPEQLPGLAEVKKTIRIWIRSQTSCTGERAVCEKYS